MEETESSYKKSEILTHFLTQMIMCRLWRELFASLIHIFGPKIPSKVHLLHFANQVATLIMHSTITETTFK